MLHVLECFSSTDRRLSPSEIARRAHLPRATAHRIIQTLRQIGFLDQDRERDEYRLGLKLFELGNMVVRHTDLHRTATRSAASLARVTGDMVTLSVFDGAQSVIINRFFPDGEHSPPVELPDSVPAHCTASGKTALAFQPEAIVQRILAAGLARMTNATLTDPAALRQELKLIRDRGYAIDNGEFHADLRCVAAPIRDLSGQVFAAISLSGRAARMPGERLTALAGLLTENALTITRQLAAK